MKNEEWKPVVGFEESYEVSSLGRVRALPRVVPSRHACGQRRKGKVLKLGKTGLRDQYRNVFLSRDGKVKPRTVHSLVAEAFIGPRPERHQCNHKNGITDDNRPENLEWVTAKENHHHALDMGLIVRSPITRKWA